jgi:hypothetical protein
MVSGSSFIDGAFIIAAVGLFEVEIEQDAVVYGRDARLIGVS